MTATSAPLVSVILPTRNRAALLPRAVASVLGQTYRNFELLVVDDASTDGTRDFLASIDDPRVRTIRRDTNHGAAAARNHAIREARGTLLAFQDDDDYWLADKLRLQVEALEREGAQWCLGGYIRLSPWGHIYVGGDGYLQQMDYRRGVHHRGPDWSLIATPAWLVSRELVLAVGLFDERIRSWDDWELGLRLFAACRPIHVDQPLYVQDHLEGGGLMLAARHRAYDLRIIMEKHGHLWRDDREVLSEHYYYIGRVASLYDPPPAGRAELWLSLRADPFRPKAWIKLAMSYLGLAFMQRTTALVQRTRSWLKGA